MIKELKQSSLQPLQTLGKTFYQWRDDITRMWRFTKSNGITEGFHTKMKRERTAFIIFKITEQVLENYVINECPPNEKEPTSSKAQIADKRNRAKRR